MAWNRKIAYGKYKVELARSPKAYCDRFIESSIHIFLLSLSLNAINHGFSRRRALSIRKTLHIHAFIDSYNSTPKYGPSLLRS